MSFFLGFGNENQLFSHEKTIFREKIFKINMTLAALVIKIPEQADTKRSTWL